MFAKKASKYQEMTSNPSEIFSLLFKIAASALIGLKNAPLAWVIHSGTLVWSLTVITETASEDNAAEVIEKRGVIVWKEKFGSDSKCVTVTCLTVLYSDLLEAKHIELSLFLDR